MLFNINGLVFSAVWRNFTFLFMIIDLFNKSLKIYVSCHLFLKHFKDLLLFGIFTILISLAYRIHNWLSISIYSLIHIERTYWWFSYDLSNHNFTLFLISIHLHLFNTILCTVIWLRLSVRLSWWLRVPSFNYLTLSIWCGSCSPWFITHYSLVNLVFVVELTDVKVFIRILWTNLSVFILTHFQLIIINKAWYWTI